MTISAAKIIPVFGPFAIRPDNAVGLYLGVRAGTLAVNGSWQSSADTRLLLTDNATNYVEVDNACRVTCNSSGFTSGRNPLYIAVTSDGKITDIGDCRDSGGSISAVQAASNAATTLTSSGGAVAINLGASSNFDLTLDENSTLSAPTGVVPKQSGVIEIKQGAGGSKTLAYNAFWEFADGNTPPALSTTAGKIDFLSYCVQADGLKARVQLSKAEA